MELAAGLKEYIENYIFPLYKQVDEGHNLENHILPVINESMILTKRLKREEIDLNMVYTVVAYHDLGLIKGRKNHHYYRSQYVLADENLNNWFRKDQIKLIAEAVFDHRVSSDEIPRSIYDMIIAYSDKNVDLSQILIRTHLCIKTKYPDENLNTFDREFEKAYEWVVQKDGENGYLKFYLNKEKEQQLENLHHQVKNKTLVKRRYQVVCAQK